MSSRTTNSLKLTRNHNQKKIIAIRQHKSHWLVFPFFRTNVAPIVIKGHYFWMG